MAGKIYYLHELNNGLLFRCDVVVVGSGCGGAVAGGVLAEKGFNVVIVEEGKHYKPSEFPEDFVTAMKKFYREKGMRAARGNTIITVPVARVLGGTSLVNSNICFRIPEDILNQWEKETGFDIDREMLRRNYEKLEKFLRVSKPREEIITGNDRLHKRAADLMGWSNDYFDLNAPGCEGCNRCNIGCPVGGKTSMDMSFIPHAIEHNASVLTCTRCDEIIVENGRALGIRCTLRDPDTEEEKGTVEIRAKAVVLACGAIETPLLLKKNRLCTSSGWLGKNLHLHPGAGILGFFPHEEIYYWRGVFQGHYVDEFRQDGMMFETASVPPEGVFSGIPLFGEEAIKVLKNLKNFSTSGCMIRDSSSGEVIPGSHGPVIKYYVNEEDKKRFIEGLRKLSTMLIKAGAQWVFPVIHRGEFIRSLDEIDSKIPYTLKPSDIFLYASHPQGTARMGGMKDRTVVNNEGETHEVKNLFITDASILPSAPGVNPQMGIMALASYIAEKIAEKI